MKCDPNQFRAAPPSLAVKPRLIRQLFLPPLIIALMIGLGYIGFWVSEYYGIRTLSDNGERQLELHARTVESELSKYTYLPSLLELESSVSKLLADPNQETRKTVNDYLEGLNRRSRSRAIYVMDTTGRVLATSNWRDADSYQGEDLSFRAYFQNAVRGQPGRFYGIGSTNGEPGYYLAHGLEEHGKIIGVAVVKVRLEALEERWQRARLEAFVSDENGIIILSSDPARRLKAVRPLSDDTKERLAHSLQYYWATLNELEPLARERLNEGTEKLTFPANSEVVNDEHEVSYLAQTRPLSDTPWNFTLLTPLNDLRRAAINQGILVAVAFGLVAFLLIAWNERRKVIATRLAAREALQEANSQLERRIAERTADLRASNERLKGQIRERRQAEETLRHAQDELVQAGKLAAIGQMSTSIAHELNQPLAALRTLSGNTVRFLERGALDTASANLKTINELIDRMGRITASLRSFARRGDDQGEANLGKAVDAAFQVLGARLDGLPLTLHRDFSNAQLQIDQTRLEQILVNLIGNALDAMQAQPTPELWLDGHSADGKYRLHVRDNGHGIDPETRKHLFEPFFTTKPGEQGLGLGLTLSASLAAATGGTLAVEHPATGGTAFVLCLPLAGTQKAEST
ncbi:MULTISPECIES: sensor histidine kinase [Pseudomonas]|jgi:two-component system sensor histidine kinase AauS|uniref:C4-dicarboxylate transport sensor protein DctB n=3 Tax=Pseudomonas TaxID=286 RepID=A0A172YWQ6_9PSED|nr:MULTISPECIES: sensor histidine kinase [Pseudomonas]MBX7275337.1 sensor histidine kinase [Pseudomonas sp. ERGC3:01]MEA3168663.1 two-component system, sensor histidine kinase AauS [Pseudomonas sp.]QZC94426.1 sensor histidine kinase [Pseudomonas sp. ERGC3:05]ANF84574.1 Histidine kinase [Pseudomonas antarctica]MBC8784593.1 sensor histidine kinase [Pseudomonas fluorescens]